MRIGFLTLSSILVVFASAPGGLAFTMPVAVIQSQQPRNQTQPQQGLPPKQKQDLTRMGPEDVFPTTGEESRSKSSSTRQSRRSSSVSTVPSAASTPRQSATPVREPSDPQPSSATSAQPTASPISSPTIDTPTLAVGAQRQELTQDDSPGKIPTRWAAPILIAMALIVSAALIFTLTKLVEKIKEGSSG